MVVLRLRAELFGFDWLVGPVFYIGDCVFQLCCCCLANIRISLLQKLSVVLRVIELAARRWLHFGLRILSLLETHLWDACDQIRISLFQSGDRLRILVEQELLRQVCRDVLVFRALFPPDLLRSIVVLRVVYQNRRYIIVTISRQRMLPMTRVCLRYAILLAPLRPPLINNSRVDRLHVDVFRAAAEVEI